MSLRTLLARLLSVLLPLAIAASLYLYLYPIFHLCSFALPDHPSAPAALSSSILTTLRQHVSPESTAAAPFRLLVLADPQLEGDTSLPRPAEELLPRLGQHWDEVRDSIRSAPSLLDPSIASNVTAAVRGLALEDVPRSLKAIQKRLDLLGNDYYLAHIYRTLHWWTVPTHVTVLGDLVGSQWIPDGEFEWRGRRFWERVFKGGVRVDDDITATGGKGKKEEGGLDTEALDVADPAWKNRIINVAGNHDIGYAGDVSEERIERFERVFGRANWDVRFRVRVPGENEGDSSSPPPTLRVINLNSLTLDTPALDENIQSETYGYLNEVISRSSPVEDRSIFTLLLTHLPLHKRAGVCTDGPDFSFHDSDDEDGPGGVPRFNEGGLKEQNHLSDHVSSNGILQGIFGMSGNEDAAGGGWGRNGLILTGHDHTGCDVVHFVDHSVHEGEESVSDQPWRWNARRYHSSRSPEGSPTPSIREVTLRSMMGEFGGNAGLLSIWFDSDPAVNEWKYDISMCAAGVQHIWWAVHVLDAIVLAMLVVYLVCPRPGPQVQKTGTANGHSKTPGQKK